MDSVSAAKLAKELQNQDIAGWIVGDFIDNGKSAVVLKAIKHGQIAAIKVFDRELVERFGAKVQNARIERELSLIGKKHPHLIEILDGGYFKPLDIHFVVMAFFSGTNLAKARDRISPDKIRPIISQVAAAAQFLEGHGLAHRDIKPENIGIDIDFKHAVLLDLGVIRPIGVGSVTDFDSLRPFIGTLQYSSPEFLRREESDSVEGWRAVSFYQLGSVLHDLIMRKRIFQEFESPFVKLANAVQFERPAVASTVVSRDLVELALNCLVKEPGARLEVVRWEHFEANVPNQVTVTAAKERMLRRRMRANGEGSEQSPSNKEPDRVTLAWKINDYATKVQAVFRHECIGSIDFPPITISEISSPAEHTITFSVAFEPSRPHGLFCHLQLNVQLQWVDLNDDIVSLSACALAGASRLTTDDVGKCTFERIYGGRFSNDSIVERLVPLLYGAFEAAQLLGEKMPSYAQQLKVTLIEDSKT